MWIETKECWVCKQRSSINVSQEELDRWADGELAQNVWPHWTPDQRELVISGTHPECWDKLFGKGED